MKNNQKNQNCLKITVLLVCFILQLQAKQDKSKFIKNVQELDNITLSYQNSEYNMILQIAHHQYLLKPIFKNKRSWVKDFTCTSCKDMTQVCNNSCYADRQAFKISCDASFCDKSAQNYKDEEQGIQGFDGQILAKLKNKIQILIPLIFVTKLQLNIKQSGKFNIFDPQSSFDNGIILKQPNNELTILNKFHLKQQQIDRYCPQNNLSLTIITQSQDLQISNIRISKISIINSENQTYSSFQEQSPQVILQLSLDQLGISLPHKLFKNVQKYLIKTYFPHNNCKLISKKFKCIHPISMKDIFQALIIININNQNMTIPIHMLFTSCGQIQCITSIIHDEKQNSKIILGHQFLQLYHMMYSVNSKQIKLYHKFNQWTTLIEHTKINTQKIGFLHSLILIIYHVVKKIIIIILYISLFSLCVSCIINWRKVCNWFRRISFKSQKNIHNYVPEDEYIYQSRPFNHGQKVRNPFDDMQTL